MYRTLSFKSSWSNEWVFDEHENPVSPGARELAESIAAALGKRVPHVTAVSHHSFYGWCFTCEFDEAFFYHVLNPVDADGYLTVEYGRYWLHWVLMKHATRRFDEYLSLLADALSGVPKVSEVRLVNRMIKHSQ